MPDEGSRTLYFVLSYTGGLFDRLSFIRPEACPEFDGDEAWARVHWWSKANHKVIEIVTDRSGGSELG